MTVVDRKRLSVVTGAAGVTVNGVAPAYVHTEMIRHVMENPEFRNRLLERILPCILICQARGSSENGQSSCGFRECGQNSCVRMSSPARTIWS